MDARWSFGRTEGAEKKEKRRGSSKKKEKKKSDSREEKKFSAHSPHFVDIQFNFVPTTFAPPSKWPLLPLTSAGEGSRVNAQSRQARGARMTTTTRETKSTPKL